MFATRPDWRISGILDLDTYKIGKGPADPVFNLAASCRTMPPREEAWRLGKLAVRGLRKEAVWRRSLSRQAESGQSVSGWCRERGVAETAFQWWRKELVRRVAEIRASLKRMVS